MSSRSWPFLPAFEKFFTDPKLEHEISVTFVFSYCSTFKFSCTRCMHLVFVSWFILQLIFDILSRPSTEISMNIPDLLCLFQSLNSAATFTFSWVSSRVLSPLTYFLHLIFLFKSDPGYCTCKTFESLPMTSVLSKPLNLLFVCLFYRE